jgi:hypothetical protein
MLRERARRLAELRDATVRRACAAAMSREAISAVSAFGRGAGWRDAIRTHRGAMRRLMIAI